MRPLSFMKVRSVPHLESRSIQNYKLKTMACLCGGGNYKNDLQIGTMQFLPVEFKVSGRLISLLDAKGTFLVEQVQQYQEYQ